MADRRRWWAGLVASLVLATAWGARSYAVGDWGLFVHAGRLMLSVDAVHALDDPAVQTGPGTLLLARLLDLTVGGSAFVLVLFGQAVVAAGVWSLVAVAVRDAGPVERHGRVVDVAAVAPPAAAGLAVLVGAGTDAMLAGHPSGFLVPLAWGGAALLSRRGRWVAAALLVAGAAAVEPWGIVGGAALFAAPTWSGRLRAGALAALAASVAYAPLALFGDAGTTSFAWRVREGVPVAAVLGAGTPFTWLHRLVQGAVMGGAALVAVLRRPTAAVWVVPAVAGGLRVLTDPQAYGYYFVPLEVGAALGLAWLLAHRPSRWGPAAALLWLGLAGADVSTTVVGAGGLLAGFVVGQASTRSPRAAGAPSSATSRTAATGSSTTNVAPPPGVSS